MVDQDLTVRRGGADARGKVHNVADGGVIGAALITDAADRRRAFGEPHSKADFVSPRAPARDHRLHRRLHLHRHLQAAEGRRRARHRRIQQQHQPVTHEAGQRRLVTRDDAAERFVIFLHQAHNLFGVRPAGEAGKAAQIAKDHDDFGTMAVQQLFLVAALDEFGDLRREKTLQSGDALGAFLRQRQFDGHLVESVRQILQLVAGGDLDLLVEPAGADAFGALTQQSDRADHPARQEITETGSEDGAEQQQQPGPPQGCTDRGEGLGSWFLDKGRPARARYRGHRGDDRTMLGIDALGRLFAGSGHGLL